MTQKHLQPWLNDYFLNTLIRFGIFKKKESSALSLHLAHRRYHLITKSLVLSADSIKQTSNRDIGVTAYYRRIVHW